MSIVPGNDVWCVATPKGTTGVTRMSQRFSISFVIHSGMSQSVPSGPTGPCCSVLPTGMTTSVSGFFRIGSALCQER